MRVKSIDNLWLRMCPVTFSNLTKELLSISDVVFYTNFMTPLTTTKKRIASHISGKDPIVPPSIKIKGYIIFTDG